MLSSDDFEIRKKSKLNVSVNTESAHGAHAKPIISGVSTDAPQKLPISHKKTEAESENLLEILSTADKGHSPPTKSSLALSTEPKETDNKMATTNVGRPSVPTMSDAQNNLARGLMGDSSSKSNTSKPPFNEMTPLKTAATVNFDSEDDGEDLLADLGLADDTDRRKESSRKSVTFSEEVSTKLLEKPKEQEKLELPKFPWQKKVSQEQPSVIPSASEPNENGHVTVKQGNAKKLELPRFPQQKTIQPDSRPRTLLSLPEDSKSQKKLSENLLELGDPFAKTTTKSSPSKGHKQARDSSMFGGGSLTKESLKSARADPEKQSISQALDSPERVQGEGNSVIKNASVSLKTPAGSPKQSLEGMLDLGYPFAKKPKQPAKPKVNATKQTTSEGVIELGDPFAKINQKSSSQSQPDARKKLPDEFVQDNLSAKRPSHKLSQPKISPRPISDSSPGISENSPHLAEGMPTMQWWTLVIILFKLIQEEDNELRRELGVLEL